MKRRRHHLAPLEQSNENDVDEECGDDDGEHGDEASLHPERAREIEPHVPREAAAARVFRVEHTEHHQLRVREHRRQRLEARLLHGAIKERERVHVQYRSSTCTVEHSSCGHYVRVHNA